MAAERMPLELGQNCHLEKQTNSSGMALNLKIAIYMMAVNNKSGSCYVTTQKAAEKKWYFYKRKKCKNLLL